MPIDVRAMRSAPASVSARVAIVTKEAVNAGVEGFAPGLLESAGFIGGLEQVYLQPLDGGLAGLVGVGAADRLDTMILRRVGGIVARACSRHARVALEMPDGTDIAPEAARQAVTEGLILGGYNYTAPVGSRRARADADANGESASKLARVDLLGSASAASKKAVRTGALVAAAVCAARDLVNEPGGSLTPPELARRAERIAEQAGLGCEVWTEDEIVEAGLGGLLGVNRGSTQPPRFVRLSYRPGHGEPSARLAWVGKGITFDAGGLSLKTTSGMLIMKMDMAGAAAVIAAMSVLPALESAAAVDAYLPMTDNMLGGDATRVGDVLTIRNGKTIEVVNTDAEGRLILADALSLASEESPDLIVDVATLTGACMVGLGRGIAGMMGNDDALMRRIRRASDAAGERVWQLPLPEDYEKQIDSAVADMKNVGGNHGGAITAALILQKFVGEGIAWAHLDIAGPCSVESDDGENVAGATGFGVRTLVELAQSFSDSGGPR